MFSFLTFFWGNAVGLSKEIVFKLGSREWTNGVRSLSLCVGIILSYEGATN